MKETIVRKVTIIKAGEVSYLRTTTRKPRMHTKRAPIAKETTKAVQNNNDRERIIMLAATLAANFGRSARMITLTCSNEHKPESLKNFKEEVARFIKSIKRSNPEFEFIIVVGSRKVDSSEIKSHWLFPHGKDQRLHAHIITKGIDPYIIKEKWHSYSHIRRVSDDKKFDEKISLSLAKYLIKHTVDYPKGMRRYSPSHGLKKPIRESGYRTVPRNMDPEDLEAARGWYVYDKYAKAYEDKYTGKTELEWWEVKLPHENKERKDNEEHHNYRNTTVHMGKSYMYEPCDQDS